LQAQLFLLKVLFFLKYKQIHTVFMRNAGKGGEGRFIAEQAVKAHNGTVFAENGEKPKGLIVTITLPLLS
jgi:signal transduction histidine kinase